MPNTFYEVSGELGVSAYYESTIFGQGISFYDFDNDGWDDLTLCNNQGGNTLYKNLEGTFEPWQNFPVPNAKCCLWGDLDNDGDNEIIFSTLSNGLYLFNANDNGYYVPVPGAFQWLDQVDSFNNLWLFGMSLADINSDGFLDLVVANYNTEKANFAFLNQQGLNFQIDPNTAVKSFHKATFQPAAVDINHDRNVDLYFANDYEHGNDFFYNHLDSLGQTTWTLASQETGLNIAISSMCNSWCDYDNDLDLDVYVSNLEPGNKLMRNNGNNFFQNFADSIGLAVHRQSWSSLWIDANNDQWNDLMVTSASADNAYTSWNGHLFMGVGNGQFAEADTNTFLYSAYNSSKGDFNRDGLSDIAMSASNLDVFKLYQNNDSSQHHYIRFTPKGHLSNANGIGCHYYLYTADNTQYGYIQSGENYLGQNSQHIILGLGQNEQADSLIVEWPSGIIDKYYNITHASEVVVDEGKSKWYVPQIPAGLCSAQDSIYYVLDEYYQYLWMDGEITNQRWIYPGTYNFEVYHDNQIIDSNTFVLEQWNINKNFEVIDAPCNIGSFGALVNLDSLQQYQITPDRPFSALLLGEYNLNIITNEGCAFDTTFTVQFQNIWDITIVDTTWICADDSPDLDAIIQSNLEIIETPGWPEIWSNDNNELPLQLINVYGCSIDSSINIITIESPSYTIDTIVISNGIMLSIQNVENGIAYFESNGGATLEISSSGDYYVVLNNNECDWIDTLSIEISLPNSMKEIEYKSGWTMHGDLLKAQENTEVDTIEIFNILGQQIPYYRLDDHSWIIPNAPFPLCVKSKSGISRPYYMQEKK
ncbi:MAG: hypothetical protein RL106_169 [Bacteroidota bacterium]